MEWTHIDTAVQNESVFDLYEKAGVYKVNVDSCELMNGYWHDSEDLLGRLAVRFARRPDPHILIGGLGLGYTLIGAHDEMKDNGAITVAEVSSAVIGWFKRFLMSKSFPVLPENVTLLEANVVQVLKSDQHFDVIALDVDNGPQPLSQAGNGFLYSREGLRMIKDRLGDDGVLLVWSGFEDWSFVDRAEEVGFNTACMAKTFPIQPNVVHFVYALSRQAFSTEECELIDSNRD